MKKISIFILMLAFTHSASGWGQKGHDVTAYIAEQHLTAEAARKIDNILNGHSLVYYAHWLDNASHTPDFDYTRTWHYINIDEGETLESMTKEPKGDILRAITTIVSELKAGGLSAEEEVIRLKILIHLLGDIHQPMHLGRLTDRGGNRVPVLFFDRKTNLHSVWDSALPEAARRWSYTEWQVQIDRLPAEQKATVEAGEVSDWARDTWEITQKVYEDTPEGTKISYDYVAKYTPIIEQQFLKGGIRLARLLNEIYK